MDLNEQTKTYVDGRWMSTLLRLGGPERPGEGDGCQRNENTTALHLPIHLLQSGCLHRGRLSNSIKPGLPKNCRLPLWATPGSRNTSEVDPPLIWDKVVDHQESETCRHRHGDAGQSLLLHDPTDF